MFLLLAEVGFLVGDYVYHRWFQTPPPIPPPAQSITMPTSQVGTSIPLVYGRTKVNGPIMAWAGDAEVAAGPTEDSPNSPYVYGIDMFFNIGIGFNAGVQLLQIAGVWSGGRQMLCLGGLAGIGGLTDFAACDAGTEGIGDIGFIGGCVQFYNGNPSQELVDPSTGDYLTFAGQRMVAATPAGRIPSYRGYLSILLFHPSPGVSWIIGSTPQPDSYAFEIGSYPSEPFVNAKIGTDDCNPADVIYDLLTAPFGKLGLDPSFIDTASFIAAAETLDSEGHGFSRCWDEGGQTARDLVNEVLAQIDGTMSEDPVTGLMRLKLIRADYDPNLLPIIDPSKCSELQNFSSSGWVGLPNMMTVVFIDRANNYQSGSGVSQNQGNAVGQDGEVYQTVLQMPGICTQELADAVAARELTARSQPIFKCTAVVGREFYRTMIGDPIILNWPEAGISRIVCRVAAVNRGTLANGAIQLALIQDYFYQWRRFLPEPPVKGLGLGSHGVQIL